VVRKKEKEKEERKRRGKGKKQPGMKETERLTER
jgi:hypothetical protein